MNKEDNNKRYQYIKWSLFFVICVIIVLSGFSAGRNLRRVQRNQEHEIEKIQPKEKVKKNLQICPEEGSKADKWVGCITLRRGVEKPSTKD